MAVTVKSATLWRRDVENRPGALASTLEPLAKARVDLRVVMGYRLPGAESRAVVEVHPVSGKRATAAAATVGLSASTIPTLIVEGDNRAGLGHAISQDISEAGINLAFVLAQVSPRMAKRKSCSMPDYARARSTDAIFLGSTRGSRAER
jgi:hypothetical protein